MDYRELASELLQKMHELRKARPQQSINKTLQGEDFILQYIANHEGSVLPGNVCHKMGVSSARIAVALNKLESKGLITRQIDEDDRRRILVLITKEGKALAEKRQQLVTETAVKMLRLLGEHDAKEYVRITGKLADIISQRKEKL